MSSDTPTLSDELTDGPLPEDLTPGEGGGSGLFSDRQTRFWILASSLSLVVIYSYWNTLSLVSQTWDSAQYSHAWMIPIFTVVLLWLRREPIKEMPMWHLWVGFGLILLAYLVRVEGTRQVRFTIDNISLIPALLGVFVLAGGLSCLKWAAGPIIFLLFMFPLPDRLVDSVLKPLQKVATISSTYALQTLGAECYRKGNNIHIAELPDKPLGVVDQCSGLRMVTIFLAMTVAIAMIATNRPWWERVIVLLSAIPIAILVNSIRITVTGLLYSLKFPDEVANHIFHDWAGYFMMPIAFGFLFLEMKIMSSLIIDGPETQIVRAYSPTGGGPGSEPSKAGQKKAPKKGTVKAPGKVPGKAPAKVIAKVPKGRPSR